MACGSSHWTRTLVGPRDSTGSNQYPYSTERRALPGILAPWSDCDGSQCSSIQVSCARLSRAASGFGVSIVFGLQPQPAAIEGIGPRTFSVWHQIRTFGVILDARDTRCPWRSTAAHSRPGSHRSRPGPAFRCQCRVGHVLGRLPRCCPCAASPSRVGRAPPWGNHAPSKHRFLTGVVFLQQSIDAHQRAAQAQGIAWAGVEP